MLILLIIKWRPHFSAPSDVTLMSFYRALFEFNQWVLNWGIHGHGTSNKVVSSSKRMKKSVIPRPLQFHPYVSRMTAWVIYLFFDAVFYNQWQTFYFSPIHTFDSHSRSWVALYSWWNTTHISTAVAPWSPTWIQSNVPPYPVQYHNSQIEFETIDDNDWAVKPTYHIRQWILNCNTL